MKETRVQSDHNVYIADKAIMFYVWFVQACRCNERNETDEGLHPIESLSGGKCAFFIYYSHRSM